MYRTFKVLAPPDFADDPKELAPFYQMMRSDSKSFLASDRPKLDGSSIQRLLTKTWRGNCTFVNAKTLVLLRFSPFFMRTGSKTCSVSQGTDYLISSPFIGNSKLFDCPHVKIHAPKQSNCLYDFSAAFFSCVSQAFRSARAAQPDAMRIEILCGDAFVLMDQVSCRRAAVSCPRTLLKILRRFATKPSCAHQASLNATTASTLPTYQTTC